MMVKKLPIMRKITTDLIDKGTTTKRWFTPIKNSFRYLILAFKYSALLVLLFFLAGHERANPKIGKTSIEFFSSDFRMGILLNIKNTQVNCYSENLEKKLIYWFYSGRQFQPAWTLNYETNTAYHDFISLIESAENYGLFSDVYKTNDLKVLYNKMHNSLDDEERLDARVRLERAVTLASFRFMIHLSTGLGDYDTTSSYLSFINGLPAHLNECFDEQNIRKGILNVQPSTLEYVRLQKALEDYLKVAANDTLQYNSEILNNSDSIILARLVSQGYLAENFIHDSLVVSNAIRSFQRFHCIEESGAVNKKTLQALCLNTKNKFHRVSLNLNRLRRDELKNMNSILVNIPEFRLHYYDQDGKETQFNIIVGKKHTPTPVLTSEITRVIANPYWTVPKSITYNEIIPKLRRDSSFLMRNGFQVIDDNQNQIDASSIDWKTLKRGEFDYWIRQKNSGSNALGVVKFHFPNNRRVYLHDTQSKKLFNRNVRAFSHGCIRVQNPQELAQMILNTNKKEVENLDIHKIINSKQRRDIRLDEPVSIFIRYYTCTADSEGNIYYHPDIYSRDRKEIQEIIAISENS